ncbi:MAG: right-handed parallel beta-helix repeat-containing protein [Clostridiales bacterium]|nr:right-handed parallel beta-helix repeat-containing protein [Clostridiales bacterium]
MILSLFTMAAGAEDNEVALISGGTTTEYADYKDAFRAAGAGDTIKLLKDITLYGSESLTISAGADLTVDGNGHKITSPYNCFYCATNHSGEDAANKTKLTLRNLTVDSTQNSGKSAIQLNWNVDLLIEGCTLRTSNDGVETAGCYSTVTIRNSSLYSTKRWGVKATNCNTYILENTKIETTSNGACIEVLKGNNPGANLTLTNCDFTSTGNFALWLHDKTIVTINGGTYKTVSGNANKPAAVNIDGTGSNCDVTINDGTFSCDYGSAVTISGSSTLNINGGTFNYTGASTGSALVASAGSTNITGGTFVSNGTGAVISMTGDSTTVDLVKAKVKNAGTSDIYAFSADTETVLSPNEVHYYGDFNDLDMLEISHSCSFENDLTLNYYVKADDVGDFEDLVMTVEKEEFKGNAASTASTVTLTGTPRTVDGENYIVFKFTGIASYQMGNQLTAKLAGIKNNVHYTTSAECADINSVKQYAEDRLAETNSGLYAQLLVDLLNYGAASQTYFGYRTDALANANLTAEQKALPADYDPDVTDGFAINKRSGSMVAIGKRSVVFGANTSIKVYFSTAGFSGDTADLKAVFKDEAGNVIAAVPFSGFVSEGEDLYSAKLTTLPIYKARETVTVEITENETVVSDTLVYSIESYCARRLAASQSANFKELLTRTIKYADSAEGYFDSVNLQP